MYYNNSHLKHKNPLLIPRPPPSITAFLCPSCYPFSFTAKLVKGDLPTHWFHLLAFRSLLNQFWERFSPQALSSLLLWPPTTFITESKGHALMYLTSRYCWTCWISFSFTLFLPSSSPLSWFFSHLAGYSSVSFNGSVSYFPPLYIVVPRAQSLAILFFSNKLLLGSVRWPMVSYAFYMPVTPESESPGRFGFYILMANRYLKYNLAKTELLVHPFPHKQDTCCFPGLPYFFIYPCLPT